MSEHTEGFGRGTSIRGARMSAHGDGPPAAAPRRGRRVAAVFAFAILAVELAWVAALVGGLLWAAHRL
jgi:hypothetical protein